MNVLLVGSELTPLAKAGGLADVMGSLPKALAPWLEGVYVAIPFHEEIDRTKLRNLKKIQTVSFSIGQTTAHINVWKSLIPNSKVPLFLFESKKYLSRGRVYQGTKVFDPTTKKLAKSKEGQALRYLVFSFAVYEFIKKSNLEIDIVHGQDYHTAPLLALVKNNPTMQHTQRVLTIHNLGVLGTTAIKYLRLFPWNIDKIFTKDELKRTGGPRLIRLAIDSASSITTVSPQYAKEILTPQYGSQLDALLRKRRKDIVGLLNGIDTDLFDPAKDKFIVQNYSYATFAQKAKNKVALQREFGLPVNSKVPLIGLASRLSSQKGLELFIDLLPRLAELPAQFVFKGTGPALYTKAFFRAQKKYPDQFFFHNIFDVPYAQKIYAASDMFLMPSKFEPCGLGQIIAMRYGSVPIVRATGGLKDTVHNNKNGFTFQAFTSAALWRALNHALDVYYQKPTQWERMIKAGMTADHSWTRSAKSYVKLYKSLQ